MVLNAGIHINDDGCIQVSWGSQYIDGFTVMVHLSEHSNKNKNYQNVLPPPSLPTFDFLNPINTGEGEIGLQSY